MKKQWYSSLTPIFTALVIFYLISVIYFNPLFFGKALFQTDTVSYFGMSKEIEDFREKTGEEALWTNSMFGGMPANMISVKYKGYILDKLNAVFSFGLTDSARVAGIVLRYFLGFFLLLLVLRVNPWLSIAGAIAFGFSSYFFIILLAGHNTKAIAIAYMAPVLAGIILTYRGKYIWGAILMAIFLSLEIRAGHPQITYYLMMIIFVYGLFELSYAIKKNQLARFAKYTGVALIAVVFAGLSQITYLWMSVEYSKQTHRGGTELVQDAGNQTSGLNKDYITEWSYGIDETFSLLVPNIKGGVSIPLSESPELLDQIDPAWQQDVGMQYQYWGDQPFTAGPVYVGSAIIFFFILSLFILKGRMKWAFLTITIIAIILSWGKNFMPVTDFFLSYVPLYSKFRAVTTILVIAELCIPLLAILGINEIVKNPKILIEKQKQFITAFAITVGLLVAFIVAPKLFFNFYSQMELANFEAYKSNNDIDQVNTFIAYLGQVRIEIFKADVIRSLLFVILAGSTMLLYRFGKIKKGILIFGIGLIFLVDLGGVAYRYINDNSYVSANKMKIPYTKSMADQEILKDTTKDYRVLNLAANTFNDASTSYFHKSIGGYHGAKLARYQDLIDRRIYPEIQMFANAFNSTQSIDSVKLLFSEFTTLNMLNARYFILSPNMFPVYNPESYGNAWFVNDYLLVDNAEAEIRALDSINPLNTAVIREEYALNLNGINITTDTSASIELVEYMPNYLKYETSTNTDQLAVFSEIYYKDGWNAYVNGIPADHFRADYVLRSMMVPAGVNVIEFKYEPRSYFVGEKVSFASSVLILLALIGMIVVEVIKFIKNAKQAQTESRDE